MTRATHVPCPSCTANGSGPGRTLAVLCGCQDTDTPGWVRAPVVLELPEPPRQGGGRSRDWRGTWAKVNAYKAAVWQAAIQQVTPSPNPPEAVRVSLHYRLWARRDPANLYVDAKPLLDALKQRPSSRDKLKWKQGVWMMRGFYVDDDRLEYGSVTQEICRDNRGVLVTIEAI